MPRAPSIDAAEAMVPAVGLILLCGILGFQIWQWRRLSALVSRAQLSRPRAFLLYLAWSMVPSLALVLCLACALALESGPRLDVISEPMARASPFIVGFLLLLGLLGSATFGIACLVSAFTKRWGQGPGRSR